GLDPAVIEVVRNRKPLAGLPDKETTVIALAREIAAHRVTSETYSRALNTFGETTLVDVVSLMGGYAATATRLTAVNQQMPPGWKQFLPLPFTPPLDIHPDSRSRLPYIKGTETTPGPLYSRGLAPEGTGPGQFRQHGSGMKLL